MPRAATVPAHTRKREAPGGSGRRRRRGEKTAWGEAAMPILMMGEERFAVAVADGFSRVTKGKQIGVCTVMAGLNAAGIQMAFGAVAQAWEDSSPMLVIAEGLGVGASRHTHFDMAEAFKPVTKWVGKIDRADLRSEEHTSEPSHAN